MLPLLGVFAVERESDARVGDRVVRARVQVGKTAMVVRDEVKGGFENNGLVEMHDPSSFLKKTLKYRSDIRPESGIVCVWPILAINGVVLEQ